MSTPPVTIAFVPRETISQTTMMLDTLIEHTDTPYELLVVTAGYPAKLVADIRRRVDQVGGRVISLAHYATPNEARNAALAAVKTEYVAFVDHDAYVDRGWLAPIVDCANETGAAIVSPIVYELEPLFTQIHMLGGEAGIVEKADGGKSFREVHYHAHKRTGEIGDRRPTGLIEFHAVLVEVAWLRSVGGLDPDILSVSEHWAMCIDAARSGRDIFLEPRSRVNYVPPSRMTADDVRWFTVRWSEEWNERSIARLCEKYGFEPHDACFDGLRRFLRGHREHRFVPWKRGLSRFLGRRAGRLAFDWLRPILEAVERPALRHALSQWETQRRAQAHSIDQH